MASGGWVEKFWAEALEARARVVAVDVGRSRLVYKMRRRWTGQDLVSYGAVCRA
jgi:hypothetical protein